jgi:transcriptional regulator with XRE-family HTH domain
VIDHDPEIDRFQKLWQREKLEKESQLALLAGLSPNTVSNMFSGKTKRPQHATFGKMAHAMGYHYDLVRDQGAAPDYEKELPKARAEFKLYKSTLAKRKARRR